MKTMQSKVQPRLLRKLNERHVLTALQAHGPMSRAEITRQTGISGPTVTRAVSALLESRLIEEDAPLAAAIGRPGKRVRLASTHVSVLGIVIGSKRCEVLAAGLDGQLAAEESEQFETPATYDDLLDACIGHARQLMDRRKSTVMGLGVSVPGLINRREGRSLVSPNLHQLDGKNLGDDLRHRLQIHATVLQECHALCLAEQVYGAAKGVADFAMLDMTEGLGLGVVHAGRLLQGSSGLAGELGHITVDLQGQPCGCGNRGCLETVASDTALVRAVNQRLQTSLNIEQVVAGAQSGELMIDDELNHVLQYLAVAAAAVINIFNPSQLFIHARLLNARDDLFPRLLESVAGRALAPSLAACQIIRAAGSKRLGVVAAAIDAATRNWETGLS
jgi:N-acetylglucosamine repressor